MTPRNEDKTKNISRHDPFEQVQNKRPGMIDVSSRAQDITFQKSMNIEEQHVADEEKGEPGQKIPAKPTLSQNRSLVDIKSSLLELHSILQEQERSSNQLNSQQVILGGPVGQDIKYDVKIKRNQRHLNSILYD